MPEKGTLPSPVSPAAKGLPSNESPAPVNTPPNAPLGEVAGEQEEDISSDVDDDDSFIGQMSRRARKPTKDDLMALAIRMGDQKLVDYLRKNDI